MDIAYLKSWNPSTLGCIFIAVIRLIYAANCINNNTVCFELWQVDVACQCYSSVTKSCDPMCPIEARMLPVLMVVECVNGIYNVAMKRTNKYCNDCHQAVRVYGA